MAKVTIVADTETGEITCDVDGKSLANVNSASVYSSFRYNYDDDSKSPCASINISMKPTKENGVTYHMSAYASKQDEGQKAIKAGIAEFIGDDVVITKDHSVISRDIAKALRLNR